MARSGLVSLPRIARMMAERPEAGMTVVTSVDHAKDRDRGVEGGRERPLSPFDASG
jgi:hypothetical protein